ncbi:MAG: hypothetical protein AAF752_12915, partial [Bacteroidota bacterium]
MQATFSLSQLVLLIGATYGVLLIIGSFFWRPEDRVANRLFAGILLILTLMMLGSVRSVTGLEHDAVVSALRLQAFEPGLPPGAGPVPDR